MMKRSRDRLRIPAPKTIKPLDPNDPNVNPEARIQMVSILYHAEKAARKHLSG